jgi:hypothetical protein
MLRKTSILIIVFISSSLLGFSQILGGGTQFSNAVIFNQSWLTGCPAAGTSLSNQVAFEPTTALDACAPAPVCNTGTTGSDIWFSFFAQTSTASIVINPSASFNVAIQAFSGSACPGLTTIGCVDAGGNNAIETLNLTGLTINQVYYFRVFGSSNGVSNRTGTYTFCGSTQLGSSVLAVEISSFNGSRQNNNVVLNWVTESESNNAYFEVEKSIDGVNFQTVGKVAGAGTTSLKTYYNFTDIAVLQTDIIYYRLKEVSNGGIYKHSTTIIIRGDNKLKNTVAILNNPVNDKIKISVSADAATKIDFKIINSIGQVVCNQSNTLVKGNNIFAITRLNNIYKGLYTLQATINNQIQNIRFVCVQ